MNIHRLLFGMTSLHKEARLLFDMANRPTDRLAQSPNETRQEKGGADQPKNTLEGWENVTATLVQSFVDAKINTATHGMEQEQATVRDLLQNMTNIYFDTIRTPAEGTGKASQAYTKFEANIRDRVLKNPKYKKNFETLGMLAYYINGEIVVKAVAPKVESPKPADQPKEPAKKKQETIQTPAKKIPSEPSTEPRPAEKPVAASEATKPESSAPTDTRSASSAKPENSPAAEPAAAAPAPDAKLEPSSPTAAPPATPAAKPADAPASEPPTASAAKEPIKPAAKTPDDIDAYIREHFRNYPSVTVENGGVVTFNQGRRNNISEKMPEGISVIKGNITLPNTYNITSLPASLQRIEGSVIYEGRIIDQPTIPKGLAVTGDILITDDMEEGSIAETKIFQFLKQLEKATVNGHVYISGNQVPKNFEALKSAFPTLSLRIGEASPSVMMEQSVTDLSPVIQKGLAEALGEKEGDHGTINIHIFRENGKTLAKCRVYPKPSAEDDPFGGPKYEKALEDKRFEPMMKEIENMTVVEAKKHIEEKLKELYPTNKPNKPASAPAAKPEATPTRTPSTTPATKDETPASVRESKPAEIPGNDEEFAYPKMKKEFEEVFNKAQEYAQKHDMELSFKKVGKIDRKSNDAGPVEYVAVQGKNTATGRTTELGRLSLVTSFFQLKPSLDNHPTILRLQIIEMIKNTLDPSVVEAEEAADPTLEISTIGGQVFKQTTPEQRAFIRKAQKEPGLLISPAPLGIGNANQKTTDITYNGKKETVITHYQKYIEHNQKVIDAIKMLCPILRG